ncbi:MAG TPA: hypothetical protein VMT87_11205 [Vicinamibacteria bacterium]|nr:hypothetical protein [Vicinamibacteria bacterium]
MNHGPARALALLVLALPATVLAQEDIPPAEQYRLRIEYREYRPVLTGTVQKGSGQVAGTLLDLEDDLGILDKRTFEVHGAIQFRTGHKLRLSYTRLDYEADVPEASRSFTFGSTRFERFSNVITNVKGAFYSAEYEWDVVKGPRGFLGVLLGAKAVDMDWVIVSPPSQRETDTLRAPMPSLGAAARLYAGPLSIDGELSGLGMGAGTVIEAQTSARLHISDRLALQGGYRLIKLKGEQGLDLGDVRLSGFTFGLELSL